MEKATLTLHLQNGTEQVIPVAFNPSSYSIDRNMHYSAANVPGLSMPILQFVRGETRLLKLELFIDSSDRSTVALSFNPRAGTVVEGALGTADERLGALRKVVTIDGHLHAPPVVTFAWGEISFDGVVTQYTEAFSLFGEDGKIERAKVTLQLSSYASAEQLFREIDQHSPDRTKTVVVRAGDRLDRIAAEQYGDPALWPTIARANGVARPRFLAPGTLLVVPPLD